MTINRYAAQGIAFDAALGKRVAVFCPYSEIPDALAQIEARITDPEWIERISRARGAEEIRFYGGGRVAFRAPGTHGYRGIIVDVAYIDCPVDNDKLADILPCLATRGELIMSS